MEIKLKKQIETLEREITLKSVDLDEDTLMWTFMISMIRKSSLPSHLVV